MAKSRGTNSELKIKKRVLNPLLPIPFNISIGLNIAIIFAIMLPLLALKRKRGDGESS